MNAPSMPRVGLTVSEIQEALAMWSVGKNTLQIAAHLGVHESVIYNRIANWRRAYGVTATDTTVITLGFHQRGFPSPSVVAVVPVEVAQ